MTIKLSHKPFYFIRHGETEWNKNKIIMGRSDIPLNQYGIEQAYQVQKFLRDISFSEICTSPLKRAYKTAEILNEAIDCKLTTHDDLVERGFGELEGSPYNLSLSAITNTELPMDAESFDAFEIRVLKAMEQILQGANTSPLIVAHGGVFVVLAKHCAGNVDIRAANCQPFLFRPPEHETHPWFICEIGDEEK
ncbi:MAG: histidine phosphatase family protein [Pseudomonadota bacterium]